MIELSEVERSKLSLIASRPKTSQRDALRARIVLEAAAGGRNVDIARKLGVSNVTVGKWRSRFAIERLAGLVDAPRSGAPRQIADEKVEIRLRIVADRASGWSSWCARGHVLGGYGRSILRCCETAAGHGTVGRRRSTMGARFAPLT